jgi:hypothetical protein
MAEEEPDAAHGDGPKLAAWRSTRTSSNDVAREQTALRPGDARRPFVRGCALASSRPVEDALLPSGEQIYENATVAPSICGTSSVARDAADPLGEGLRPFIGCGEGAAGSREASRVRLVSWAQRRRFSTEAVHTGARANVTCVTPLGEETASTS